MKRYALLKESVGKKIGADIIYIHRSAIDALPTNLQNRVEEGEKNIPSNWKWNFVITNANYIAYTQVENFDKEYEPVIGARWKVFLDGSVKFEHKSNKPLVLHQRYKTVKSNYNGFDLEDDRQRELWYRQYFNKRAMSGAGYLHNWEKMLKSIQDQK